METNKVTVITPEQDAQKYWLVSIVTTGSWNDAARLHRLLWALDPAWPYAVREITVMDKKLQQRIKQMDDVIYHCACPEPGENLLGELLKKEKDLEQRPLGFVYAPSRSGATTITPELIKSIPERYPYMFRKDLGVHIVSFVEIDEDDVFGEIGNDDMEYLSTNPIPGQEFWQGEIHA